MDRKNVLEQVQVVNSEQTIFNFSNLAADEQRWKRFLLHTASTRSEISRIDAQFLIGEVMVTGKFKR